MTDQEMDNYAAIWLKVKLSKKIYTCNLCIYHQWKLLSVLDPDGVSNNLINPTWQADKAIGAIRAQGNYVLAVGDINIDHLFSNDPRSQYDLQKLHECLDITKDLANLEQLNFCPTRHRSHVKSSLLDPN